MRGEKKERIAKRAKMTYRRRVQQDRATDWPGPPGVSRRWRWRPESPPSSLQPRHPRRLHHPRPMRSSPSPCQSPETPHTLSLAERLYYSRASPHRQGLLLFARSFYLEKPDSKGRRRNRFCRYLRRCYSATVGVSKFRHRIGILDFSRRASTMRETVTRRE